MSDPVTVPMEQRHFFFDRAIPAAVRIRPGDHVVFETEDANASFVAKESDLFPDFDVLFNLAGGANPITGPVHVEGAKPGDRLAVDIVNIKPAFWRGVGYTALYANLGALQHMRSSLQQPMEARTKICRIEDGFVLFQSHDKARTIRIPANPFIGTIGVAPKEERIYSSKMGQDFCGNVDIPDIRAGSTVILPVHVDGALLSLGDVHACQGDGEITACALEVQAVVEVRVRLIPAGEAGYGKWPQLHDERYLGVIVPLGYANYTEAMQIGYTELVRVMAAQYGFDELDAYQLLNLVGEMRLGSELSCLYRIDRKYL